MRVVNSVTPCPLHVMRSVALELWKWRVVASLSAGVASLQSYLTEKVRHFPGNISAAKSEEDDTGFGFVKRQPADLILIVWGNPPAQHGSPLKGRLIPGSLRRVCVADVGNGGGVKMRML